MQLRFSAKTECGPVRPRNEDNYLADPGLGLFLIADGMGARKGGATASALAVNLVRAVVRRNRGIIEACAASPDAARRRSVIELLKQAALVANRVIHDRSAAPPELQGMATTLTALLLVEGHGFMAHVGDTRLYLWRGEAVHQISEDHSLINALLSQGKVKSLHAIRSRFKNAVTRAVGIEPGVQVDLLDFEVLDGDCFLLCSDGVYDALEDERMSVFLGALEERDPEGVVARLLRFAIQADGQDNATALWVEVERAGAGTEIGDPAHVRLLRESPLFFGLSERALGVLAGGARERTLRRGEVLQGAAERGEPHVFLLEVGRLGLYRYGVQVEALDPPSCLGAELLLRDGLPLAQVRAATDCRLLAVPRRPVLRVIEVPGADAQRLLRNLTGSLSGQLQRRSGALFDLRARLAQREGSRPDLLDPEALDAPDEGPRVDIDEQQLGRIVRDTLPDLRSTMAEVARMQASRRDTEE